MSRPDLCPNCGASTKGHTGTYCHECGETLTPVRSARDERTQRAMDRLLTVVPQTMSEIGYQKRTCILQARVATVVLRELGFRARPLACQVFVGNPAWAELLMELGRFPGAEDWQDRPGVWNVVIGYGRDPRSSEGYDGHVVTVVEDRYILDLAIDQANRPKYEIDLAPAYWPAPTGFLAGTGAAVFRVNGSWLRYDALPDEKGFLRAADWTEIVKPHSRYSRVNPLPRVREAMA